MVARETNIAESLARMGISLGPDDLGAAKLARLTELLETVGVQRGMISARDTSRVLSRHVLECAALQRWLPQSGQVVDVGSGAGLPGFVLATLRADPVILVEAAARRAAFLGEVRQQLGLPARIVNGRAERLARGEMRESSEAAVARALARPPTALELTMPFCRPGGVIALLVGSEDAARARGLREGSVSSGIGQAALELGGSAPEVHGFEVPGADERRWVMIVHKVLPTPDRYPRSVQAMRRRPLGAGVV